MYLDYIMDIFDYPDVRALLGRKRKVLLKVRIRCLIDNADCLTEDFLHKIQNAASGVFSHITYYESGKGFLNKIQDYLTQLEELSKLALDIITHSAQNTKTLNSEHDSKTYNYVHKYGEKIKVVSKAAPPSKGVERNRADFRHYENKLPNSLSRTKQKILELSTLNDWDYFCTFTINKEKFDRKNLDAYMKSFAKYIQNYSNRKTDRTIKYLLVPELGKHGAYHLHGMISGIPLEHLTPFDKAEHPKRLVDSGFLNWTAYEQKFGFCSFDKNIRSKEAVAWYMTKKINKSSKTRERGLHKRLYYCSQGLTRSTEICRGYNLISDNKYDYENDHTAITWFGDSA